MSMLALDLRRSFHVIRRYGVLVGIAAAVSLLAGIATAAVSPATVTSTALVVLPQAGQNAAAADGEPAPFMATQEVIAESYPVLAGALPDVRPAMSLSGLRHDIQIGSPAPYFISVSARGDTAGDAEAAANAVARSYLQYVGSASSPAGRVPSHLLEPATSVTGTARLLLLLVGAGLGAVSGVLTGVIAAVVSRRLTS
jgi:capsular polysaccharide biosynthesis protein